MSKQNRSSIQSTLEEFRNSIINSKSHIQTNLITEKLVKEIVGAEFSSIWIYDARRSILVRKRDKNFVREISVKHKRGVLYKSFMTQEAAIYNNLATEIEYDRTIDNPDDIKMKAKIIIPIIEKGRLIGIATAYSAMGKKSDFSDYSFNLFKVIIPYIVDSIHKMREYKGLERRARADRRYDEVTSKADELSIVSESENSDKDVLNYMATVVHDIRTPANSLYGFLDLLEDQIEDSRLKQYVKNAKESASFINELTTSILDKASHKDVSNTSNLEIVNSAMFFSQISELFVSNMYNKRISFNIFIDPLMPREINIDTLKLKRIIMNLIGNAYKFTPTNECIEFSVRYKSRDKKIHIFIKDSGIGIAKEKQEQIFEEFKQAEDDTNSKYGGHGLGLAICAGYVKELGGHLQIESEIDEGSTFYFDIPIETQTQESIFKPINSEDMKVCILMATKNSCSTNNIARYIVRMGLDKSKVLASRYLEKIDKNTTHIIAYQNRQTVQLEEFCKTNSIKLLLVEEELFSISMQSGIDESSVISQYSYFADKLYSFLDNNDLPRVLIADDDRISISLLKNILNEEFCSIETAYNGEIASELLANSIKSKRPFSVVYMDNDMPMLSGDEVINSLRSLEKQSSVKAAYTVSISGDIFHQKSKNSNYNTYVGKPFNKNEIRDVLYKAISQ